MKLKPCPFCGLEAVTEHVTFENPDQNRCAIVCKGCGAYGGPVLGSVKNKIAIESVAVGLWNTRADEARIRRETIEKCKSAIPTNWLDPLLSGDNAIPHLSACLNIEKLLLALRDRISALAEEQDAD